MPEADALFARVIAFSTDAGDEIDLFWWSTWASVKVKLAQWDEAISLRRKALDAAVRFDGAESTAALVEYYFLQTPFANQVVPMKRSPSLKPGSMRLMRPKHT